MKSQLNEWIKLIEDIIVVNWIVMIIQLYYVLKVCWINYIISRKNFFGFLLDPLVALWPFLCIVSAVLILVTVILIYEKRQRAAKKAAALEDEVNDSANDP
jgi:uncharacterized membrane protein